MTEEKKLLSEETIEMPAFEFKCQKCGKKATLVISISEYEKKSYKCPKCGSKRLERLISTFQVKTSRKS